MLEQRTSAGVVSRSSCFEAMGEYGTWNMPTATRAGAEGGENLSQHPGFERHTPDLLRSTRSSLLPGRLLAVLFYHPLCYDSLWLTSFAFWADRLFRLQMRRTRVILVKTFASAMQRFCAGDVFVARAGKPPDRKTADSKGTHPCHDQFVLWRLSGRVRACVSMSAEQNTIAFSET